MTKERVVIIIPTYNESLVIHDTITYLLQTCVSISQFEMHILIFDSHSTDNTITLVQEIQAHHPCVHLLQEPQKTGLGSAYFQAMNYALHTLQADIVFEFDADLSHQPHYIQPMLDLLATHDVVVGSRYVRHGSIPQHWGVRRKLLSLLGNYTARMLLTFKYKDFTSGFRATRRQFLTHALLDGFISQNYAYKLQLFWSLHLQGARIIEYPIEFIDREKGYSKLPSNSIFDALHVLFTLRYRHLKRCVLNQLTQRGV